MRFCDQLKTKNTKYPVDEKSLQTNLIVVDSIRIVGSA